ncbi:MAG TPA: prolyl oligopeptidase family serine peptidase, partial [Bacteroidales bacterium]|nr:prolyl oligopeptidase family serine peptidase [Bacteroidales bacterium]
MKISDNGNFIVYERNPYRGDGTLIIQHLDKETLADTVKRAGKAVLSPGSDAVAFAIFPEYDTLKKLKLQGIKKDKLPKDSMGVYHLKSRKLEKIPMVKSFQFPEKNKSILVWHYHADFEAESDKTADSLKPKKKKTKTKKDDPALMGIWDLKNNSRQTIEKIKHYTLSGEGNALFFVQKPNDTLDSLTIHRMDLNSWSSEWLFSLKGEVKQFQSDKAGAQLALVTSSDTAKSKVYELIYWAANQKSVKRIDTTFASMPEAYHVSEHGKLQFSDDQQLLYLGIAPKPLPTAKDSLTEDEKVRLDIWNWKDQQLQSQQLKQLDRGQKRTYLTAYYPDQNRLVPLASAEIPDVKTDVKRNPVYLLGSSGKHYEYLNSWEQTRYVDYYRINRINGDTLRLLTKANSLASLSPMGDYLLYYDRHDSNWYSKAIATGKIQLMAGKDQDIFYHKENDIPNEAGPLGMVGWTDDSKALVYSLFGIWQLDPASPEKCKRILGDTQNDQLRFRYQKLDPEEIFIPESLYLSVFDEQTKKSGYARFNRKNGKLELLLLEDARLSSLMKAKNAAEFLFRKERFEDFPDYYLAQKNWRSVDRLTDANPQQQAYCWGSVEIISWVSYAGDSLQGLMYLPFSYNEQGSFPVLVYYYERNSDNLHRHYAPKPSRSVINFSDYTSRGYGVFVPDIVYRTGKPGQSAYDAVMSGVDEILKIYPGLDSTRMGLQGQSWGGYQTAWLITRTDRFKAAMAGALVSNMTSAYGGIRWGSGMVRAFQYEDGQSRIGKDLWSDREAYIVNSPLFYADQVNTPLLMMHNDEDDAVPWYQGIEFFTA